MRNKMNRIYKKSFNLNEQDDKEFFEIIKPLLEKEEVHFMKTTIQHSDITTFEHVTSVAFISYLIAKKLDWNYRSVARAAMLHDLVYYDWHNSDDNSHRLHGYRHPGFAAKNASELTELSALEENIIRRHMWPLTPTPPKYKEAWLVCLVDKYCATRETLKPFWGRFSTGTFLCQRGTD